MYLIKKVYQYHIMYFIIPIIKVKLGKAVHFFGSYHMSIQNKKVILIQNEKEIHVHYDVLRNLGFSNSKVLGYLTSNSVLIVELYCLNLFYQGKKLPFRRHIYLGYQLYCTKSQSKLKTCDLIFHRDKG